MAATRKTKPQGFKTWVIHEYSKQLHSDEVEGSRKFRKFLESISPSRLSGAYRSTAFHLVKFSYPLRRSGYITTMYSARVKNPDGTYSDTTYAYAYWPRGVSTPECPEYLCISPTFESRDGEYRDRLMLAQHLLETYENLAEHLSLIEEVVMDAVRDGVIELNVSAFPSSGSTFVGASPAGRLEIKTLVVAMALDVQSAMKGLLQAHISPSYIKLVDLLSNAIYPIIQAWGQQTRSKVSNLRNGGSHYTDRCGQKLVPLTVREALNVDDINYAPWRELRISRDVTDLVINRVAPMYPIHGDWCYLNGVNQSLFENRAMRDKYIRSVRAEGVIRSLREAREAAEDGPQDYRMGQLDAHIYEALEYAQEFAVLTDLAMLTTSEFIGRTVQSIPTTIKRWPDPMPEGYRLIFSRPDKGARYLFDLCYGSHVLHTRSNAIHADLHLNNMTLFQPSSVRYYADPETGNVVDRVPGAAIAYILDSSEAGTYIFPHDGYYMCLIDFSRVIIGPDAKGRIAAEKGESYATGFYRSQVSRALRVIYHYAPVFTEKNQEKIKGLLLTNFDAMFRIMTAVDFLAIGRNIGVLLRTAAEAPEVEGDLRRVEVSPAAIEMAAAIEDAAREHLISNLTKLVSPGTLGVPEIPMAGEVIIPAIFDRYRYVNQAANASKIVLVDAYNAEAPLEYSSQDYARFPPWAQPDLIKRNLAGLKMSDVLDRGEQPLLKSLDSDGLIGVLQEKVREMASDEPVAATSSWIAD